jgi:hypothetical protein
VDRIEYDHALSNFRTVGPKPTAVGIAAPDLKCGCRHEVEKLKN